MRHVFVIGSKGVPASYGGFETFVDRLIQDNHDQAIKYHVACIGDTFSEFEYKGARCFGIKVPHIGAARAVLYDWLSLRAVIEYIAKNGIQDAVVYVLAARIGPLLALYSSALKRLGVRLLLNPDGHEWKRAKWNRLIKMYWRISERLMVGGSDLVICDSREIQKYITLKYRHANTTFIPYGADVPPMRISQQDNAYTEWCNLHKVQAGAYFLVVGRFVPENNIETIITEFMSSSSKRDLALITDYANSKFYKRLMRKTGFTADPRIKFVGTVYDQRLLGAIRANAYAYIHGHEVGGTNPSLLEALSTTTLNIVLDVPFNREVVQDGGLYFMKAPGNLSDIINHSDELSDRELEDYSARAKSRILGHYSWDSVIEAYAKVFIDKDQNEV